VPLLLGGVVYRKYLWGFIIASTVSAVALPILAQKSGNAAAVLTAAPSEGDNDAELVSDGDNPVLRFGVAHYDDRTQLLCKGYLYFSRDTIRYQVLAPARDLAHAFEFKRSELESAQEWRYIGSGMGAAEFKFRGGITYHFYDASWEYGPGGADKLGYRKLVEPTTNFEAVVARAKTRLAKLLQTSSEARPMPPGASRETERSAPPTLTETAIMKVRSKPGGVHVYVNNEPKGTTSVEEGEIILKELPAGSLKLRLSLEGYKDWTQTITLAAGQTSSVEAELTPRGAAPFTLEDILELLQGGVSAKRAATLVQQYGVDFALTQAIENRIRAAGGDSDLLLAIAKAKK